MTEPAPDTPPEGQPDGGGTHDSADLPQSPHPPLEHPPTLNPPVEAQSKPVLYFVDLAPAGGGELVFESHQALSQWASKEVSHWQWLKEMVERGIADGRRIEPGLLPVLHDLYQRAVGVFEEVHRIAEKFTTRNQAHANLTARLSRLSEPSQAISLFLSNSGRFKYVQDIAKTERLRAALVMCALCGMQFPNAWALEAQKALLDAALFLTGRSVETLNAEIEAARLAKRDYERDDDEVVKLRKALSEERVQVQGARGSLAKALEDEKKTRTDDWEKWKTDRDTELAEWKKALQQGHEEQLKAIRTSVDHDLRLRKPVVQWMEEAKKYAGRAKCMLVVVGAVAIVPALLALLFHQAIGDLIRLNDIQGWVDYWRAGPVVMATFVYIWALRIAVRLFLAFQHISTEAGMRARKAEVYLALIKQEGVSGSGESLRQVLEAMFKPIETGLGGGEQPPPLPQTLIQNIADGVSKK